MRSINNIRLFSVLWLNLEIDFSAVIDEKALQLPGQKTKVSSFQHDKIVSQDNHRVLIQSFEAQQIRFES